MHLLHLSYQSSVLSLISFKSVLRIQYPLNAGSTVHSTLQSAICLPSWSCGYRKVPLPADAQHRKNHRAYQRSAFKTPSTVSTGCTQAQQVQACLCSFCLCSYVLCHPLKHLHLNVYRPFIL